MDVYFYPSKVIELKGSEIAESKRYAGLSLRFPRVLRLRDDKRAEDVTLFENLKIGRKNLESFIVCLKKNQTNLAVITVIRGKLAEQLMGVGKS